MKIILASMFTLLLFSQPAAAADYQQALKNIKARLDPSLFSGAALSAQNLLMLRATDKYAGLPDSGRSAQASGALIDWRKELRPDIPSNLMLSVKWKDGGELWLMKYAGPARIDSWSDGRLSFSPGEPGKNRFFGYLGGQIMRGGDMDTVSAFNGRLGTTLFGNRCDAAVIYGHSKAGSFGVSSYGLTGRALFPLTGHVGWNLGGSFTRSAPSEGGAENSLAALGGINFYLPGGSFDITASAGNHSMYSLLVGYTLYLTRK